MRLLLLTTVTFAFAIAPAHLALAESACPKTITVEQKASAPAPDWSVSYSGYETALQGVTIFDGPPAQQASLVPDDEKTTGDNVIQTWRLIRSDRGHWLQCNYANTTAQIAQRLPNNIARCDVVYDHNMHFAGGGYVVKSVNCE